LIPSDGTAGLACKQLCRHWQHRLLELHRSTLRSSLIRRGRHCRRMAQPRVMRGHEPVVLLVTFTQRGRGHTKPGLWWSAKPALLYCDLLAASCCCYCSSGGSSEFII
jgi:hypothetical protein